LHRFSCIVDKVAERPLQSFRIRHDQRQVASHPPHNFDRLHAACEHRQRVFDDRVQVGWAGLRGGKFRQRGELIDEGSHAFDRP